MERDLRLDDSRSLATLVGGIIGDAQTLIRQEIALARTEIQREVRRARSAAFIFGAGLGVMGVGAILCGLTLVHLLQVVTGLPLWPCYAVIGGITAAAGFLLFQKGRRESRQVDFVPHETVESIRASCKIKPVARMR